MKNLNIVSYLKLNKIGRVNTKIIFLVRLTYLINCGTITQGK